eukprot:g211.t1
MVHGARELQRVLRGMHARKQLVRMQSAAIQITAAFRHLRTGLLQRSLELHRRTSALEASNQHLQHQLAQLTSDLEQRTAQKERYQRRLNEVLETMKKCPITHEQMGEPVLCTVDGYRYERAAIAEWVNRRGTSPMTRQRVSLGDLIDDQPRAIGEAFARAGTAAAAPSSTTGVSSTVEFTAFVLQLIDRQPSGELQVAVQLQMQYARQFGVRLDADEWSRFTPAGLPTFERLGHLLDHCASESHGALVVERRPHLVLRRGNERAADEQVRELRLRELRRLELQLQQLQSRSEDTPALQPLSVSAGSRHESVPTAGYVCQFCGQEGGQPGAHWHQVCPLRLRRR